MSKKLSETNTYAGKTGRNFVSGAGIWLSKDNVLYICNNKLKLNTISNNLHDDVAIGSLFNNCQITDLNKRYDIINNNKEIEDKKKLLNDIIKDNHYHIRIKHYDRNIDLNYVNAFTKILYNI